MVAAIHGYIITTTKTITITTSTTTTTAITTSILMASARISARPPSTSEVQAEHRKVEARAPYGPRKTIARLMACLQRQDAGQQQWQ